MAAQGAMSSYWRGVRDGFPFIFVVGPFGMLFGVLATEAGLEVYETLAFSIVVIAGAAQFAALQLMNENAPTLVIIASALAVNMRMAMYSAAITPHLGGLPIWKRGIVAYFLVDQTYALPTLEYERNPDQPIEAKFAYFMGVMSPVCPMWYVVTLIGALLGNSIPPSLGLDFALPIAFIAMIGPMLRTPAHRMAASVAVVLALSFAWVPYNLGLIIAGIGGMMAGAQTEVRLGIKP